MPNELNEKLAKWAGFTFVQLSDGSEGAAHSRPLGGKRCHEG